MSPHRTLLAGAVLAAAFVAVRVAAQTSPPLDAKASDPAVMGWMKGSPPPPQKTIRFADSSFRAFPQMRWAVANMNELVPVRFIRRTATPSPLPRALRTGIDAVTFTPIGGAAKMTWAQSLDANYTDAIVVLHNGRIVYERYFGIMTPEQRHIAYSVTKSLVATIAASLIVEGKLDDKAPVSRYVPELAQSGFGDATIRQLLDMTTTLDYTEDYTDANASVWRAARADGLLPRPPGYDGPDTNYGYLQTVKKTGPHGVRFTYRTVNTDALGWVLARVTGKRLADLLAERIWTPLGMESDAYVLVDSVGTEFAGGGLNLVLRDMARFGEMMRLGGKWNGKQVIAKAAIEDIERGGKKEDFAPAGYKTLPGWSYRNMWWVSHNAHGAYMARGIHGQGIYVDPKAGMVIARFASHPMAGNVNLDPTTLPAFQALAEWLMRPR